MVNKGWLINKDWLIKDGEQVVFNKEWLKRNG